MSNFFNYPYLSPFERTNSVDISTSCHISFYRLKNMSLIVKHPIGTLGTEANIKENVQWYKFIAVYRSWSPFHF